MSMMGGAQNPFERRRGEIERIESMQVRPYRISGVVLTKGAGEVLHDVKFPVWFVERPAFSFGGELDDNQAPEETNFPQVSVVVLRWKLEKKLHWKGASLGIVTHGKADQRMWVHWHAEGRAFRNPVGGTGTPDGKA